MSFVNREKVQLQDKTGALVTVLQNKGGVDYVKQLLVLGNHKEAVLIMATFPQRHEQEHSQRMKASLLTASWDSDKNLSPTEGLNFAFSELGNLKIANRMLNTIMFIAIELEQSNKVSIDNLSGYETIAKAKDTPSSQPMVIYQAILFERASYYLMQGLISEKQSQNYLPLFREMAKSFKRKNP